MEKCLISKLPSALDPMANLDRNGAIFRNLSKETEGNVRKRRDLIKEIKIMKDGLDVCERHGSVTLEERLLHRGGRDVAGNTMFRGFPRPVGDDYTKSPYYEKPILPSPGQERSRATPHRALNAEDEDHENRSRQLQGVAWRAIWTARG